jgi:sugar phosphate isomerase/epimerase
MNQLSTCRWSLVEDVLHYRQAGFSRIGLWRQKVEDFGVERTAELLADNRVSPALVTWAGGFTGNCGNSWQDKVNDASCAIRMASRLGAESLLVYPGGRNRHIRPHARRLLATAMAELQAEAAVHEVVLAIKPVHKSLADDWSFMTQISEAIDFVEAIDSPWVKLCIDTYHFATLDAATCQRLAPLTAVLQLGDTSSTVSRQQYRCELGHGVVCNRQIVESFLAAGFAGTIDIKLFGASQSADNYQQMLATARDMVQGWTTSAADASQIQAPSH